MIERANGVKTAVFLVAGLLALGPLGGCKTTTTVQAKPGLLGEATGRPAVQTSGFLGDYSQLRPGKEGRAALVYVNPAVQWNRYGKVMIEPVQFWGAPEAHVDFEQQQVLTSYLYNALRENLQQRFALVERPGEGVLKIRVALTDATAARPVLRSASVVVPQARLINKAQSFATGSYAFVGSVQAEGEILDSVTGERLAAAVDKRSGGMGVRTATQSRWGDAQESLDYWARTIVERIATIQAQGGKP